MRYVLYVMMALGAVALGLSANLKMWSYGGQGAIVLVCCALPIALGAFSLARGAMPRWAAIVSALSLLLVGMKTTDAPFDNIMMAAFGGLVLAIVLAIKPAKALRTVGAGA